MSKSGHEPATTRGTPSSCSAAPVTWWPADLLPNKNGLYVIGVRGSGEREAARRHVREALRQAIAQLYGLDCADIMIHFSAGVSPAVSFSRLTATPPPGISISHDGPLSLAAIHLHGPVGVDLMQVQEIDDWRTVARDYLGPARLAEIEATPSGQRAAVLAGAWTEHEARLKCHSRQLGEWAGVQLPAQCRPLDLPAPFVGTIALPADSWPPDSNAP